ncbi:MAG: dihydroorotase [Firmicutes bacterium]|nr:dihydroorotase [Candidatus Fermentithermobacillaceae bacterium]
MARDLLIKGGRVVDPASGLDGVADILVSEGKIARVDKDIASEGAEILDVSGMIVMPGLIDMHVHLREPGFKEKEDIESGSAAAAVGGFTAVACMPNTEPALDNDAVIAEVVKKAAEIGLCRVYPIGAVTKGRRGQELAELGEMKAAGAVAFSDDGSPVSTSEILRCALEYLKAFDCVLMDHPEDLSLSEGGQINRGLVSTIAGFKGIPHEAEEIIVARDILVAGMTGGRLHLTHISTKGSVELIRRAKEKGLPVTCDCTPHHLLLTDKLVLESGYDTNTKMNPPLRTDEDLEALWQGLSDGTIDAIATDHAPHHVDDKWVEYDYAANGITGLETAVGLIVDKLVRSGSISWTRMAEAMSLNPARILGVPGGTLAEGAVADITVIDPELEWSVNPREFRSKGKNTPFEGWRLDGAPYATILGGKIVAKKRCLVS